MLLFVRIGGRRRYVWNMYHIGTIEDVETIPRTQPPLPSLDEHSTPGAMQLYPLLDEPAQGQSNDAWMQVQGQQSPPSYPAKITALIECTDLMAVLDDQ